MTTALATSSDLAIDLSHVAKTYGRKVHALRGIDMRVGRGEVFGFLGPNGAGKSTLVKILMTVIRASRCGGTVLGRPVGHKPTLARVGYLPEHHKFPDYLSGRQVLDFFGALAGVERETRKRRIPEMLELLGMGEWADTKVKKYSKGMRQRTGVAQALMNDPDLVLLDEPTDGVDPVGRRDIRDVVRAMKERGKTVFINSHLLSELEMVCDRVAILVQGKIVAQGTLDELTAGQRRYEIVLDLPEGQEAGEVVRSALPGRVEPTGADGQGTLAKRAAYQGELATGETVEIERDRIWIGTDQAGTVQPVIDSLRARGVVIRSMRPHRPSLEDLFMQAVRDPTTGRELKLGAAQDSGKKRRPSGKRAAEGGDGRGGS